MTPCSPPRIESGGWDWLPGRTAINERVSPTVIVARKPRAGHELEFERWLQRITDAAARMPGHLGSDLQPPGPRHPDEWVIVYQFDSQSRLDDWIDSPLRTELLAEGAGLTEGDARVQQLATSTGDDPLTAVATFRVLDGQQRAFERDYEHIVDSMATFDGFLNAQLFPPVEGVQDETVIVFSFQTRQQLDVWFSSAERRLQLERLKEHTDGEHRVNVVGGFGGWFNLGPREVKTWKQAATVLLGALPTVLLLNEVLDWILPDDFPYLLAVLVGNAIGVATLSWILMPKLTATLGSWLRR